MYALVKSITRRVATLLAFAAGGLLVGLMIVFSGACKVVARLFRL
jgi:hypothetical protein